MSKPVTVAMLPKAFQRYRLSLSTGVLLGILMALLLAFMVFHQLLMDEPERVSRLLLYYLFVLAPVGIVAGMYGLHQCRQEFVRVGASGINIDTPLGPQEVGWADLCCIDVREDRAGNVLRIRLHRLEDRSVVLYPYLPLHALRQALEDFRPPHLPVEVTRSRVNWFAPETQNLILAAAVALLAVLLWR